MSSRNSEHVNRVTQDADSTEICDLPFLVIAGSYRSGSTALFNYLGTHPDIYPTRFKETGYFMPLSMRAGPPYPLTYGKHRMNQYLSLFDVDQTARRGVRLEATPTYLYVPEAAQRIAHALPQAKVLICLREPVTRLVSWFQTLRLLRQLEDDASFSDFLSRQKHDANPAAKSDFKDKAQLHGCYAPYVKMYLDLFGKDRVMVLFLSELQDKPQQVLADISEFIGVSPGFFKNFEARRINSAKSIRYTGMLDNYLKMKRVLWRTCGRWQLARRLGNTLRSIIEPSFFSFVSQAAARFSPPDSLRQTLEQYYLDDALALTTLLGREPPWLSHYRQRTERKTHD